MKKNQDSLEAVFEMHPSFYEALRKQEFIVEDTINEVERAEQLRLDRLQDATQYHLTVNPTLDCNFNCWYCYETKVKGSEMTPETVKATCNLIKNILSEKKELKRFHLYFFGGEPLMKFDSVVIPIIDSFDKQTKNANILRTVHITTNGALLTKDMMETLKHFGIFTSFQITFDGYGDTHNNSRFSKMHRKSYNMLVTTIKQLVTNDFHVTLRINFSAKNTHELNQVLDDFKDLDETNRAKIVYTPVRIWQDEPKRVTRSDCEKYPRSEEDVIVKI